MAYFWKQSQELCGTDVSHSNASRKTQSFKYGLYGPMATSILMFILEQAFSLSLNSVTC